MEDIVLEVKGVTKSYKLYDSNSDRLKEAIHPLRRKYSKTFHALNNISFKIRRGTTVGILGKNGSGKSTLLKIVTGVLSPSTGGVKTDGKVAALLELGAGFNPEHTGLENIYLNGLLMGISREQMDEKIDEVLRFADIGDFIHQPVKSYSSGMFARLAFAVSINVEPDILIIDEALSVGDVFFQNKCFEKIKQLKQSGVTILFVSHDVSSISTLCDYCLLINEGKLVSEGLPRTVINDYVRINNDSEAAEELQKIRIDSKPDPQPGLVEEIKEYRYGDRDGVICGVEFEGKESNDWIVYTLEPFKIIVHVEFYEECNNPVVAFYLKNKKGLEMYSGNTHYLKSNIGPVKKGQQVIVEFVQNMYLAADEYIVSIGLSDYIDGVSRPLDRRYDMYKLTVKSERQVIGIIDLDSKVKVIGGAGL